MCQWSGSRPVSAPTGRSAAPPAIADVYTTTITFANIGVRIGTADRDIVRISDGHGTFTLSTAGVVGSLSATVAVDIPNVVVAGTFTVGLNTTTATPTLRVLGTGITIKVAGRSQVASSSSRAGRRSA